MKTANQVLAENLDRLMKSKGLNNLSLGKKAGVAPNTIKNYLTVDAVTSAGKERSAKVMEVEKLAKALGVTLVDLLSGPPAPEGEPDYDMPAVTVQQSFQALAELVQGMDPVGRELATTMLAALAKNPEGYASLANSLANLAQFHSLPQPPSPRAPAKDKEKAKSAAKHPPGKAKLTVMAGGGNKQQYDLPLRTVANPFNAKQASASERNWYSRVKAAPKAKA